MKVVEVSLSFLLISFRLYLLSPSKPNPGPESSEFTVDEGVVSERGCSRVEVQCRILFQ